MILLELVSALVPIFVVRLYHAHLIRKRIAIQYTMAITSMIVDT